LLSKIYFSFGNVVYLLFSVLVFTCKALEYKFMQWKQNLNEAAFYSLNAAADKMDVDDM